MLIIADVAQYFFGISIFVTSLFLVLLVLVQRGRGGGLTGALGGPGGQSAFGTKAGDLFTRITVCVAAAWIALCAGAVFFLNDEPLTTGLSDDGGWEIGSTDTGMTDEGGSSATTDPVNTDMPAGDASTDAPAETGETLSDAVEGGDEGSDEGEPGTGESETDSEDGETESDDGEEPSGN